MAEIRQVTSMFSRPGVQRDGTLLDKNFYADGQWVRFQRGRPKKMGGYKLISNAVSGPIRSMLVWSKGAVNLLYSFSHDDITLVSMDQEGGGSSVYFLTPVGFTLDENYIWSVDTMYDSSAGAGSTIVMAVANTAMSDIGDDTPKQVYYIVAGDTVGPFVAVAGMTVSGGICAVAPYLIYYGADGFVGWSDVNQPRTLTGGDAGSARVTGAKIVKGLPIRGGTGPSALLWSLDSLIRMDWVGGVNVFKFTTVTGQSSIIAQNSVIEYDGSFFWVGIDRFLRYAGGVVSELPNNMNINWFFDNLNYAQRQKVWAMKVPRFGEIWWFFPFGSATECTNAVIYNVREDVWYDCTLSRSAGFYSQVFHYPVMGTAIEDAHTREITIAAVVGTISVGDIIRGNTSGYSATVTRVVDAATLNVYMTTEGTNFTVTEGLTDLTSGASATFSSREILTSAYAHEKGLNAIEENITLPIDSWFETCDFGYPTGGAQANQPQGPVNWTRLVRIEPDFIQSGNMTVVVRGKEFANSPDQDSDPYSFLPTDTKVDMREQRREIRLKFRSNALNGNFETGNVLLSIEPGDVRS